ncbi:ADP-D-ribose binding [Mactra antiquata]
MPRKGRHVVVEWEAKENKNAERLEFFIKAKMPNEKVKVTKHSEKSLAQVEFTSEQDPEYLKILWSKKEFWKITNIYAKEDSNKIIVENIPSTAEIRDIYRYFTNARNVKVKLTNVEVEERYFRPMEGFCVLRLASAKDVQTICAKMKDFTPFRKINFVISPFYDEFIQSDDGTSNKYLNVEPIIVADIDGTKLMYLKEFCSYLINEKLSDKCGKIEWCDPGIERVKIVFDCSHEHERRRHSEDWRRDAEVIFLDILRKVRTIRETIPGSAWTEVSNIVEQNNEDILVEADEKKRTLLLVGFNDNTDLNTMEEKIAKLVKQRPVIERNIKVNAKDKLIAFTDLRLQDNFTEFDINIEPKSGIVRLRGVDTQVRETETKILELLNSIAVSETDLAFGEFESILRSQLIQDKINAYKESNGWRCGFIIERKKLKVFAIDKTVLDSFRDMIMAQLSEQQVRYEGKEVVKHTVLRAHIQRIEEEYSPYVKLSVKITKTDVTVTILSTASHVDHIVQELKDTIGAYLIKEEIIPFSPNIFQFFYEKSFPDLKKYMKQRNFNVSEILRVDEEKSIVAVVGNTKVRNDMVPLITKFASKIRSHWIYIERDGIHNYMLDGKGNCTIEKIQAAKKCRIRWATQNEMADYDIYSIVPLKTGQCIFLCHGSLKNPSYPVDAIVIAADRKLQHKRNLAVRLVIKGGESIKEECKAHMEKQGQDLNDSDVFIGSSGELRCQKVVHAVEPESDDPLMVAKLMTNIMAGIDKEDESIIRTVAMPIITAGFEMTKSAKATVVVSPTPTAPNPSGRILQELKKAANINLDSYCEESFKSNFNNNIPNGGIAESVAGRLPCVKVYHLKIDGKWNSNKSKQELGYYIEKCLERAAKNDVKEIAFPTIGTADCNYPPVEVARVFFRTVANFLKLRPTCSLEKITVIAYSADFQAIGAFDRVLEEIYRCRLHRLMADIEEETVTEESKKVSASYKDLKWRVFNSSISLEITYGNLGFSTTDVILNTTFNFPKLNGAIPDELCRMAGPELLEACSAYQDQSTSGMIVETDGFKLGCKKVYHYIMPKWQETTGEKIFERELQDFIGNDGNHTGQIQAQQNIGVNSVKNPDVSDENDDDKHNVAIPKERRHFALFQIISDNHQCVESVTKEITKQIDDDITQIVVKLEKESLSEKLDLFKGKNRDKVVEFGKCYCVRVELNEKNKQIVVKGFGESVIDCYQRILNYIKELRDEERNKSIGKIVYQHIEWYYQEDDGKIWVPYPKALMYVLEDAYYKQEKIKEFRDNDDKMYVADFNTMVEYEKSDDKALQKKTEVGMIRKDFTEGTMKPLPDVWQVMDKDENLKEVKLQNTDAEYKKVELAFNKRGVSGLSVVEYRTKKEELEDTRKSVVSKVEQNLWHGTSEGVDKSIILTGFNRSYSGKTHGDVWYGHGVYFAVEAKYALSDHYAPKDNNGIKRIFYAKVLTGQTIRVDKGYNDRFPPLIQGSNTDRYDSTCDDVANPKEYVVFKDTQAYPEYVVYCK